MVKNVGCKYIKNYKKLLCAILAYTNTLPVKTILYPFAFYSPEIQAILWAYEHKVPCRFMDLPSSVFLAMDDRTDIENDNNDDNKSEQIQITESVYRRLENLTGEEHDTFWERNFEQSEDYHEACNIFGKELREYDYSDRLHAAENTVREAYMKREIVRAVEDGIPEDKILINSSNSSLLRIL